MKKSRFRYFSKDKSLFRKLNLIFCSAILIIMFSLYIQTTIYEKKTQENKMSYGSWYAAVFNASSTTQKSILSHKMLETTGKMDIYGDVTNNDQYIGSLGAVDNGFFLLSNFTMKQGRMPKNQGEIAAEAFVLDQLGIEYTLNQSITLHIQNNGYEQIKKYKLTGIIENYSSNWLSQGELISFFVIPDDSFELLSTNMFVIPKDGYYGVLREIKMDPNDSFLINEFIEFEYDPFTANNLPYTILSGFAILYSILLISFLFHHWIDSYIKEIEMLKSIGTDSITLFLDILLTLLKSILISYGLSLMVVILFTIRLRIYIVTLIIYTVFLIIFSSMLFVWIHNVPNVINSVSQNKTIVYKPIKIRYKRMTKLRICLRSFRFNLKLEVIQILVFSSLLIFLYQSLFSQITSWKIAQNWQNHSDFNIVSEMTDSMNLSLFNRVLYNNSIRKYHSYYIDNSGYMTWNAMADSSVWKLRNSPFLVHKDNENVDRLFPDIVYVSSDDFDEFITENLSEGSYNKVAFEKGEVVYINLPPYTFETITNGSQLSSNPDYFYDTESILKEETIHLNDEVVIHYPNNTNKTLKVGGIIKTFKGYSEGGFFLHSPYRIFVSKAYFGNLTSNLELYCDQDGNTDSLEVQLSKITSENNLMFSNQSFEKRINYQKAHDDYVLNIVMTFIVILVIILTQYYFKEQRRSYEDERSRIFTQIGFDHTILFRMRLIDCLVKSLIILMVSILFFFSIYYFQNVSMFSMMDSFASRFTFEFWIGLITIDFVFLAVYFGLNFFKLKK